MDDYEELFEEITEEDLLKVSKKLEHLLVSLQEKEKKEFIGWTAEQLELLKKYYGESLRYYLYQDLVDALSGPTISETIH